MSKAVSLGVSSGLMIILGYPGELIVEGDLSLRWKYWAAAMVPFLYVVYTLLIGLQGAIASEENEGIKSMLSAVCWATVISWCTYPVVYIFPMFGLTGAESVVAIQLGYCVSDIISKCGAGFLIYNVSGGDPFLNPPARPPSLAVPCLARTCALCRTLLRERRPRRPSSADYHPEVVCPRRLGQPLPDDLLEAGRQRRDAPLLSDPTECCRQAVPTAPPWYEYHGVECDPARLKSEPCLRLREPCLRTATAWFYFNFCSGTAQYSIQIHYSLSTDRTAKTKVLSGSAREARPHSGPSLGLAPLSSLPHVTDPVLSRSRTVLSTADTETQRTALCSV